MLNGKTIRRCTFQMPSFYPQKVRSQKVHPDPSNEGVMEVTGLSVWNTQQGTRDSHMGVFTSASLSGQLPPPEPLITQAGV